MASQGWSIANPIPTTWLGTIQPSSTDNFHGWTPIIEWGADLDEALAELRATDRTIDSLFTIADNGGIAITPVWTTRDGHVHLLMEIASTTDDTDWIVVTRNDEGDGAFTASMMIDAPDGGLVRCGYERHDTPTWCIRITKHA
jgi:hypothetical protein